MLPNHWVIFWDNYVVGMSRESKPIKLDQNVNPFKVAFFKTKDEAQYWWNKFNKLDSNYYISEIEFRIK